MPPLIRASNRSREKTFTLLLILTPKINRNETGRKYVTKKLILIGTRIKKIENRIYNIKEIFNLYYQKNRKFASDGSMTV